MLSKSPLYRFASTLALALLSLAVQAQSHSNAIAAPPAHRSAVEVDNLALLERYHREVWVRKDTASVPGYMAADFVSHSSAANSPRGGEPVKQFLEAFFAAFPDLKSETTFNLVDGDRVVTAWVLTGTHSGPLFGIAPTGKPIRVSGIDVLRVKDGKFVEHWYGLGLSFPQVFQQIGATPPERK
jgi:predicted ester cyclase